MSDLSRLAAEACAWLEGSEPASLSNSVETLSTRQNQQVTDKAGSFHTFQSFHPENEHHGSDDLSAENSPILSVESRASGFYENSVESVESVERRGETPAETGASLFPLSLKEVERVERERVNLRAPFLDLNTAAPQRSDWWSGPAMAEVDALTSPAGEPLPISAAEVRAGIERELRLLAGLGVTGPEAERRAVAIVRAKIGNSPALAERQANTGRCHVCGEILREDAPVIAVLNPGGAALHIHDACHETYRVRRHALVDRIMRAAESGADHREGKAS